jgi:hypothetical protein
LWRLAQHASESARFLPISLAGVWNFRGVTGKRTGPDGTRDDVKGIIPDIELLVKWKGRRVIITYDADCASNPKVLAARSQLAWALIDRGAIVAFLDWDIRELLNSDVPRAKAELAKHVTGIEMIPTSQGKEAHYVAIGEWNLLGGFGENSDETGEKRVRMVAGEGFEPSTFGL